MKAEELRIGNYVHSPIVEASTINSTGIKAIEEGRHMYEPIPLTDEWLVKFGFTSDPYQDRYIKGKLILECDKTRGFFHLWMNEYGKNILHVHQLQNLYFALTGEELTIK